jgi:uncharacterized protein
MTQPAKVQEPSMEEILASIRRIIADDEAKPATAEAPKKPEATKAVAPQPVAPVTKAPVMSNNPPSAMPAAQAAAKAAPAPAPKPAAPPAPVVSNSQDDIDAMLAGLDAATPEPEIRPPPPPPEEEVFELTDDMVLPTPPPRAAPFRKVEPEQDLEFAEAAAARERPRRAALDPPSYDSPAAPPTRQILSHSTVAAVESAFNSLANTVLSNNARTLEDLVKEMLRPMLKSWLDDNLPGLVERIVKAEIERVSRGR